MTDSAVDLPHDGRARLIGGLATVFDQGVVSIGTFATHIILARTLPEHDYGQFALFLYVVLFLNMSHSALLVQPLSIRAGAMNVAALRPLTWTTLHGTLLAALPSSLVLLLVAAALGRVELAPLLLLATLSWQLQESLRRVLLCDGHRTRALPGDALRYLGQAGAVFWLARSETLDLASVLLCFTAFACLGAAVQFIQVLALTDSEGERVTLRELWQKGRWLLLAGLAQASTVQILSWCLYALAGSESLARFRALATVVGLSNPVFIGLGNFLLPAIARWHAELGSVRDTVARARPVLLLGLGVLIPAWGVCLIWPERVLSLAYGEASPYAALGYELRLAIVFMVTSFYATLVPSILAGLSLERGATQAQVVGLAVCILVAAPLIGLGGVVGAILASAIVNGGRVAFAFAILRRAGAK